MVEVNRYTCILPTYINIYQLFHYSVNCNDCESNCSNGDCQCADGRACFYDSETAKVASPTGFVSLQHFSIFL